MFLLLLFGSTYFPQDDENAEEVQEQLRREWGAVSVENEQNEYGIDTAELQSKVITARCGYSRL